MTEREFGEAVAKMGGRAYVVGGWVRDKVRGQAPQDKDYVVTGVTEAAFRAAMPEAKLVGRGFPVFLAKIDDACCEVAFARTERKNGTGYRGFDVSCSSDITIEDDLFRRDLTVNSMAMDVLTGELIDPYGGKKDIEAGVLRPVSEHFFEDPVRALRTARFTDQLEMNPVPEAIEAMAACKKELLSEPAERVLGELKKALKTRKPSVFFRTLEKAQLLEAVFPEIHALIGKTQPVQYHPEGDAFEHIMQVVDRVAHDTDNIIARFAGLVHDLGKGVTPVEILPHHYGHEEKGIPVLQEWNSRMTLPGSWKRVAEFIIQHHMRAPRLEKATKILDLMLLVRRYRQDISLEDFKAIIRADHNGLPYYLERCDELTAEILTVSGNDAPEGLSGIQTGEWVRRKELTACKKWLRENRPAGTAEIS